MDDAMDRRRFLALGATTVTAAALGVVFLPALADPAAAASTESVSGPLGPNLVWGGSFQRTAAGTAPPNWTIR